jgi:hypothetical protein
MDPGFSYFVECLRELLRQCSFQRKEKCTWTKLLNLVLFKSSAKKGTWTAGRPNATGPCVEFNWFHILSYPNLNKPTQVSTTLVLFDSLTLCIPAFFSCFNFFLFICFNTLFLLPKLHKRCLQICKTVVQAHLVMERLIQAAWICSNLEGCINENVDAWNEQFFFHTLPEIKKMDAWIETTLFSIVCRNGQDGPPNDLELFRGMPKFKMLNAWIRDQSALVQGRILRSFLGRGLETQGSG